MQIYWLMLGILAVWRVTHLLQAEDGPWDGVTRLRLWLADGFWGRALDCFYCLSLWVALPPAVLIGESWLERVLLWPALSGGAVLLQRLSEPAAVVPQVEVIPHAEQEDDNGMLRK